MVNHLIHVGFPKTGSKSLQQWFERHPGFAFSEWGLAGADDVWAFQKIFAFDAGVRCAVTSCEGFVVPVADRFALDFDDVPSLVSSRESIGRVAEALAALFPSARILIVTRGFRELCLSLHAEVIVSGCLRTFDEFFATFFVRPDGSLTIDYDFVIGLYERLFGSANVLVLPFELLRADPDRFAREIETVGGVGHAGAPPEWLHRSAGPDGLRRHARLRRLARWLPIGRAWREAIVAAALKRIGKRPEAAREPGQVPLDLLERFRGSAERLRERDFYRGLEEEYLL